MKDKVHLGVLGQPAVLIGGAVSVISNVRQSRLLAALFLTPTSLSHDQLAERLWNDEDRPDDPTPSIRTYANRLRHQIGDDDREIVLTRTGGYALDHSSIWVDSMAFEGLVKEEADVLDPAERSELLEKALGLWRGDAFGELAELDWVMPEAVRLEELRVVATENLLKARLDLGQHAEVAATADRMLEDHPYRESLREVQIIGLYRSDRQVDALRAFEEHRARLVEELGVDASPNLRRLEHLILTQDASLDMVGGMGRPLRGYRLRELIGSGAVSLVYRGSQPSVGRDVAIKVIRSELANRPRFVSRFQAEAQTIARLEHPHIVPLYDYWREPDRAYLVMRLLPTNMAHLMAEQGLDAGRLVVLIDQIASALDFAHKSGVIHRDVKPANILLDHHGNAFLSDFGIAVDELAAVEAETGVTSSSDEYRAPEYGRGGPVTEASDIYALGLVARHALDAAGYSGDADAVVAQAIAGNPADRFRSASDFARAFRIAIGEAVSVDEPAVMGENPYRGLQPFEEADASVYFGRDDLVAELAERLGEGSRLVTVVGASGSGKSSAVLAGLLPALRTATVPGSDQWLITTMRPGTDPVRALATALESVGTDSEVDFIAVLSAGADGLVNAAETLGSSELVVVVDQLEEVFTAGDDPTRRDQFLSLLAAANDAPSSVRVVATLRADFYDKPLEHPEFGRWFANSVVSVAPMASADLEAAIVQPALAAGAELEEGLVGTLIAEAAARPGALPLLQYTLTELFDAREGNQLTLVAYGALGGLASALRDRAEAFYVDLDPDRQRGLTHMLSRLVDLSASSTSRRAALRTELLQLDGVDDELIDHMGMIRLLSFDHDPESREPLVEISHEALMTEWARLAEWIAERRDLLASGRRVRLAVEEWEAAGRSNDYLLTGDRLAASLMLLDSGILTPTEDEYLKESQRVEGERRARRRRTQYIVAAVLVAATAISLVLAVVAGNRQRQAELALEEQIAAERERDAAEEARGEAESEAAQERQSSALARLVNRSLNEANRQPEVALLLAVEAYRRDPGQSSTSALLNALSALPPGARVVSEPAHTGGRKADPCFSSMPERGVFVSVNGQPLADPEGELVVFDATTQEVQLRLPVPFGCGATRLVDGTFLGSVDTERSPFTPLIVDAEGRVTEIPPEIWRVVGQLSDGRLFAELDSGDFDESGPLVVIDVATGAVIEETGVDSLELIVDPTERRALTQAMMSRGESLEPAIQRGVLDLSTYAFVPLEQNLEGLLFWAPDGAEFFVVRDRELRRFDSGGNRIERIALPLRGELRNGNGNDVDAADAFHLENALPAFLPSFSPEGDVIAFTTDAGIELYSYPDFKPMGEPIAVPDPVMAMVLMEDDVIMTQDARGVVTITDPNATALGRRVPFDDAFIMTSPEYGENWPGDPAEGQGGFFHVDLNTGARFDRHEEYGFTASEERAAHPMVDDHWVFLDGAEIAVLHPSGELMRTEVQPEGTRDEAMHIGHGEWVRILYATDFPEGDAPTRVAIKSLNVTQATATTTGEIEVSDWAAPPIAAESGFWTGLRGGGVEVFDWEGQRLGVVPGEEGVASSLSLSGKRLAVVAEGGAVTVYDVAGGDTVAVLLADSHNEPPLFLDDDRLLIRSEDGAMEIWDVGSESSLGTIASAPDWPPFADGGVQGYKPLLSRDNRSVWYTQPGAFIEVSIDPEEWVTAACEVAGRALTQDEWTQLVPFEEPYRDACSL